MSTVRPTFLITAADLHGPTTARCDQCGADWTRPDYDRHADTLTVWARQHALDEHAAS